MQVGDEAAGLDVPKLFAGLGVELEQHVVGLLGDVDLPGIFDVVRIGAGGVDVDGTGVVKEQSGHAHAGHAPTGIAAAQLERAEHGLIEDVKRIAVLHDGAFAELRVFAEERGKQFSAGGGDGIGERGLPEFLVGLVEDDDGASGGDDVHGLEHEQLRRPGDFRLPVGRGRRLGDVDGDLIAADVFGDFVRAGVALHLVEDLVRDLARVRGVHFAIERGFFRRGFHGGAFDDLFLEQFSGELHKARLAAHEFEGLHRHGRGGIFRARMFRVDVVQRRFQIFLVFRVGEQRGQGDAPLHFQVLRFGGDFLRIERFALFGEETAGRRVAARGDRHRAGGTELFDARFAGREADVRDGTRAEQQQFAVFLEKTFARLGQRDLLRHAAGVPVVAREFVALADPDVLAGDAQEQFALQTDARAALHFRLTDVMLVTATGVRRRVVILFSLERGGELRGRDQFLFPNLFLGFQIVARQRAAVEEDELIFADEVRLAGIGAVGVLELHGKLWVRHGTEPRIPCPQPDEPADDQRARGEDRASLAPEFFFGGIASAFVFRRGDALHVRLVLAERGTEVAEDVQTLRADGFAAERALFRGEDAAMFLAILGDRRRLGGRNGSGFRRLFVMGNL